MTVSKTTSLDRVLNPTDRERCIRALIKLCTERGYNRVTADAISAKAGVERARFGELFGGGVEECAVAAVDLLIGRTMRIIAGAYSADLPEWKSGLAAMKLMLEEMAANPTYTEFGLISSRHADSERVRTAVESTKRAIATMIDRIRVEAVTQVQPPTTARGALGGREALLRREIIAGRASELPRLLPAFAYSAAVGFLGQEEALRLAERAREMLRGTPWDPVSPAD